MTQDELIRSVVREVLGEALAQEQGAAGDGAAGDGVPPGTRAVPSPEAGAWMAPRARAGALRGPAEAALAARVAAWTGAPASFLAGPAAAWRPAKDRAGYLASTPARLGVGRAGTRYRTPTVLEFRADHAAARDAVRSEMPAELIEELGLVAVRSAAADKGEFLRRPDLGRRLCDEAVATIARECPKKPQVQIVVGDGLSATAIRVNLPRVLPALLRRFEEAKLRVGRTVYVHNARVAVADPVGRIVEAELICMLVGERPGLKSAESMGAYITYLAGRQLVEAQRSVVSNIHERGIPPEEGARRIAEVCLRGLAARGTGIDLGVK